jgi:hypothetical protein
MCLARCAPFRAMILCMTDAEKLAAHERVIQIIQDALALEKHCAKEGRSWDAIEFLRADAYKNIVDRVMGSDVLHELERERRSHAA